MNITTKEGALEVLPYDALIIATGADSFMPPIKGKEKQGILSLRGVEDGEKIDEAIKAGAKSAVIMGAGLIGLEVGVGLMERGLKLPLLKCCLESCRNCLMLTWQSLCRSILNKKACTS